MSLEYVILGWLSTAPGSGYDLVRQLDLGLTWFWSAPHSQIYPALKKLEEQGLVASAQVTVGQKQEKRVYEITPAGREAVRKWVSEPVRYPPNRDTERVKLIFSDNVGTATIREHIEAHRDHYAERLASLRQFYDEVISRKHPRIERRIADAGSTARGELVLRLRDFAYHGDIRRAQGEIEWAELVLEWLDSFDEDATEDPPNDTDA